MTASSGFVLLSFAILLVLEETMRGEGAGAPTWQRMVTNWGLGAINVALAALVPIAAFLATFWPDPGLLAGWPAPAAFIALLLARSFAAYWFHRSLHAAPWLWRIHKVHHADTRIDCSTGLRSHPFESLIAAALAAVIVIALGPPPGIVVAVTAALLVASFWHHAAIRLPPGMSRMLEWLVITPRLHLIHHSQERAQHDRNYGDIIVIWDRIFGSYAKPASGPVAVGLAEIASSDAQSLWHQLAVPLRR